MAVPDTPGHSLLARFPGSPTTESPIARPPAGTARMTRWSAAGSLANSRPISIQCLAEIEAADLNLNCRQAIFQCCTSTCRSVCLGVSFFSATNTTTSSPVRSPASARIDLHWVVDRQLATGYWLLQWSVQ